MHHEQNILEFAATLEASSTNKLSWPITEKDIVEKYLNESNVEIDIINLPLRPCYQPNTTEMYNCKEVYMLNCIRLYSEMDTFLISFISSQY